VSTNPERRLVTILVTDVVDSTPIAEQLGAERYKTLFDEIARITREQVERFGGTVAQHTGDGILALFGAPTAHEDDAERAVRAALAFHDAFAPFAEEVGAAYGVALAARVAVNTGPALVLRGDEPPDQLYNALGDTVTVAARLQSYAGAGGTILGPLTARQVEARFALEPVGELALKGRSESVAAFLLTAELEHATAQATTPLVGRGAELAALVDALEELADGRGTVAIITGEPGIGKSRLVAEAREHLGNRVRFVEGAAVAYAETFPYWPVRALLRDWLELGAGAPDAQVRLELKTALTRVLPDQVDTYPFLATIAGAPLDESESARITGLTPDSVQRQTFESVRHLVLALARERPLCLVLDDLHWADESTLDLLDDLLDATEEEAIGFLLLSRSERDHGSWRLGEHARQRLPHRFTAIELRPLDVTASQELVGGAAEVPIPAEVAVLLAERAGGNPFFLEEALRDLVERGALRRDNGSYELAVAVDRLEIPLIVQEALQARLGRLAPSTRDLVGVASVVGRSFAMPLLERLLPDERLAPLLGELQRLDLVAEERRRPAPEYRFRHGLVQEVAYASLPESRRQELHRRTAGALEEIHGNASDEIAGLLAHHLAEGAEPAAAARWFERAGDAARAQYANDESVSHYERAVVLYDEVGDGDAARHVLFKMAIGHVMAFDFPRAAASYRDAFARPASRVRSEPPTERLSVPVRRTESIVPGLSYVTHSWWVATHLYRGLLRIDREQTILPDVAESFSVSDDGTLYTFVLREDAFWHDKAPVTAHDFVWTWDRMRVEGGATADLLDPIRAARALDVRTLELQLASPSNTFLYILGQAPAFPWPSHLGVTPHEAVGELIGNGPFTLDEVSADGLRLLAAPDWSGLRGNVHQIDLVYANPEDAGEDWRKGEHDVTFSEVHGDVGADAEVEFSNAIGYSHFTFRSDAPPFDDARVRKAVACAIDRERLLASGPDVDGGAVPATTSGLIPPLMPGHVHDVGIGFDPGQAQRLLADAGHPGGAGIGPITVLIPEYVSEPYVNEIQRQLTAIGLILDIEILPSHEFEREVKRRGHLYWWAWVPDVPDPSSVFEPQFAEYPHVYRDDDLMALLERARGTTDRNERLRLYGEVDRLVVAEHAALVPLNYLGGKLVRRRWVSGVWQNAYFYSCLDEAVVDAELRDELRRSAPTRGAAPRA
jgi:ABC-type transport system substrate-binding protein/class 3 adenylate cyclase